MIFFLISNYPSLVLFGIGPLAQQAQVQQDQLGAELQDQEGRHLLHVLVAHRLQPAQEHPKEVQLAAEAAAAVAGRRRLRRPPRPRRVPQGQEPGAARQRAAHQDGPGRAPAPGAAAQCARRVRERHGRLRAQEHGVHGAAGLVGRRHALSRRLRRLRGVAGEAGRGRHGDRRHGHEAARHVQFLNYIIIIKLLCKLNNIS